MTSFARWFKGVWSRNEPDRDPSPAASSRSVSVRRPPTFEKNPSTTTTSELPVHITSDRNLDRTIQGIITLTLNEEQLSRNLQHTSVQNTPVSRYATPCTSSNNLYSRSAASAVYTGHVNLVRVRQEDSGLGDMGLAQVLVKIEPENNNTSVSSTSTSPSPIIPESQPLPDQARELQAARTHVSTQTSTPVNQQQHQMGGTHITGPSTATLDPPNRPITRQHPPTTSTRSAPAIIRSTTPMTESKFNPSQYNFTPADFQFNHPPTPPASTVFSAPSVTIKSEPQEMKQFETPPVLLPGFQQQPQSTPKSVAPPPPVAPVTPSKPTSQHLSPFTPPPSTSPKFTTPATNRQIASPPSPPSSPSSPSPTPATIPRRPPVLISPTLEWTSIRALCTAPLNPQGKRLLPRIGPPCLASGCTRNLEFDRVVSMSNPMNGGRAQYLCPTHEWKFGTFADLETEEEDENRMCYCGEKSRRTIANSGNPFWKCMEMKCRFKQWS